MQKLFFVLGVVALLYPVMYGMQRQRTLQKSSSGFERFKSYVKKRRNLVVDDFKMLLREGLSWQQIGTLNKWVLMFLAQEEGYVIDALQAFSMGLNNFYTRCGGTKFGSLPHEQQQWLESVVQQDKEKLAIDISLSSNG